MDPNAAWKELMSLLDDQNMSMFDVQRACELAEGLQEWVAFGGFLPEGFCGGKTAFCILLGSLRQWLGIQEDLLDL